MIDAASAASTLPDPWRHPILSGHSPASLSGIRTTNRSNRYYLFQDGVSQAIFGMIHTSTSATRTDLCLVSPSHRTVNRPCFEQGPTIDPFSIQDAEVLIAALHYDWGEVPDACAMSTSFQGHRRTNPSSRVPVRALASYARATGNPVSKTVYRAVYLGELEPDARTQSALGGEATRPQHQHHVVGVRGVD